MLKSIAWSVVSPIVKGWLVGRALVLPAAKKEDLAKKLGTTPEIITAVNQALISEAATEFDQFKP